MKIKKEKLRAEPFDRGHEIVSSCIRRLDEWRMQDEDGFRVQIKRYSEGYLALRDFIQSRTDYSNESHLLAAGYAVYGWMPTILKTHALPPLAEWIAKHRGTTMLPSAVRQQLLDDPRILMSLNNSVIGTSKLLHFIFPNIFPIWDSRIAWLFGMAGHHNAPGPYLSYFCLLHDWLGNGSDLPPKLAESFQSGGNRGAPVSNLRCLEYALFLESIRRLVLERRQMIEPIV